MTHTYDHCGIHFERILFHVDIEAERLGHDSRLGLVTQTGEGQVNAYVGNVDHVVTVAVGNGTRLGFIDDNGDARYRLTIGIDDFSFGDQSLGTSRELHCTHSTPMLRQRRTQTKEPIA